MTHAPQGRVEEGDDAGIHFRVEGFSIELARIRADTGRPEQVAGELTRPGTVLCDDSKIRLGSHRGQHREPARGEPKRANSFRVDAVVALPVPEHVVDGGAELLAARTEPGH